MRRVAVRAYRSLHLAGRNRLAMRALRVIYVDLGVARSAGIRDVRFECGTLRILMAQDMMRSVTTLTVGRNQQTLLAERIAMDGVYVFRIDAWQSVLLPHPVIAVALRASSRNIKRINCRSRIRLGKYCVRIPVAADARMIFPVCMDAALQIAFLSRVTRQTLHARHLVRMRICLDVRVAVSAFETAVNARAQLVAVHRQAVPGRVLHVLVGVASEAIILRMESPGPAKKEEDRKQNCKDRVANYSSRSRSPCIRVGGIRFSRVY